MTKKLTLSMDEALIERAKQAAAARNTSVSAMFARLVSGLDEIDNPKGQDVIAPLTRAATGLVQLPAGASDSQLVEDALWERYGSQARNNLIARRSLVLLRDVFTSVAPDQRILNQAIDSDIADSEDAIQFYSAVHAGADYLLTRNVSDFPVGTLPILAPEDFFVLLESSPTHTPGT